MRHCEFQNLDLKDPYKFYPCSLKYSYGHIRKPIYCIPLNDEISSQIIINNVDKNLNVVK